MGHEQGVRAVIPYNGRVYTASGDKTIREWDMKVRYVFIHTQVIRGNLCAHHLQMGDCLRTFQGHTGGVNVLKIVNGVMYSGSDDGTIRAWCLKV